MSSAVRDASKLTIAQLKTELRKQGVEFPKDARKSEYVRLYNSSVKESRSQRLAKATPRRPPSSRLKATPGPASTRQRQRPSSEFSTSEDEKPTPSRNKRMPKKGTKTPFDKNLEVVQSLTDKELREELAYYSVSAAITGTTRPLYEKKLATLLAGGKPQPPPEPEQEEEEEEEQEDFSDTEPEDDHRISDRGDARKNQTPSMMTRRRAAEKVTQEQQTSPRKASGEAESEESGGVSLWVQLLILLLIAAAIYAIWYFYQSAQGGSRAPEIENENI